jgi:hypothetical protein
VRCNTRGVISRSSRILRGLLRGYLIFLDVVHVGGELRDVFSTFFVILISVIRS